MSKTEKRKPSNGPHRVSAQELVEQATQLYRSYSQMSKKPTREAGDLSELREKRGSPTLDNSESWYVDKVEPRRNKRPESYHAGMRDSYSSQKRDSRPGEKRSSHQSQKRDSQSSRRRESYHGESKATGHAPEDLLNSSSSLTAVPQEKMANGATIKKDTGSRAPFMNQKVALVSRNGGPREPNAKTEASNTGRRDPKSKSSSKTSTRLDSRQGAGSGNLPDFSRLERNEDSQSSVNSKASSRNIPRRPVGSKNGSSSQSHLSHAQQFNQPMSSATEPANMPGKMRGLFSKARTKKPSHGKSDSSLATPSSRDHSTNRSPDAKESQAEGTPYQSVDKDKERKDKERREFHVREDSGSNLLKGFKEQTAKAARGIEKAGRGIFHKRDQAKDDQAPIDYSKYELKIINRPLIEQTRMTRIVKRIEDSKDKTEFWMPALPWRCIDYLNYNGIESEGLYRIPGSMSEVRMWKARFDQELDINLFDEPELYDINAIGSLFKAWLRDLPDDVFPQVDQYYFSNKYHHERNCPEELKEYLANLHPFHYYVLFAVTCHLSLMYAFEEQNKMSFQNLYVCFGPALRLNGDCFKWLVGDWRSCFSGCLGEPQAIEEEYRYLQYDIIPVEAGKETEEYVGECQQEERSQSSGSDGSHRSESSERRSRTRSRLGSDVMVPEKSNPSPVPNLVTLPGIGPPPGTKEYELMRLKEEYDRMSNEDILNFKHFERKQAIFEKYELPNDEEKELRMLDSTESQLPYHLRPSRLSATWTTQRSGSRSPELGDGPHYAQQRVHGESSHPSSREGERSIHRLHPRSPDRARGARSPEAYSRGVRTPRSGGSRSPEARHVQSHADLRSAHLRGGELQHSIYDKSVNNSFTGYTGQNTGRAGVMLPNGLHPGRSNSEQEPVYSHEGFPRAGDAPDPFSRFMSPPTDSDFVSGGRRGPSVPSLPSPPPLRLGGSHTRSMSQLPELDFPQPISPTFTTRHGS